MLHTLQNPTNFPEEFYVTIEISANSNPVKYEVDKTTGKLFVDRFIPVAMSYPCNYGYIENTQGKDGDAIDALIITEFSVVPLSVIKARPIGVLIMEDESGMDEKIIAVPVDKISPMYKDIKNIEDVNELLLKRIKHFFESYKALEQGKWVKVQNFENKNFALKIIQEGAI